MSPSFPARARRGTAGSLRAWQAAALEQYMAEAPRDFLAVATPGAGKTTFALRIAVELMGQGIVDKVTVVCPTEHLKGQWADAAARVGIHIDPSFTNAQGRAGSHFDGVAVTYAQVGANPAVHEMRTRDYRTLVILDEIHHAGDSLSWGDGVRQAFGDATRRLALTGTPFRSDTSPIPFVRYVEDADGIRRSHADYSYGYGDALRDMVVRPVLFMSYSGQMSWRTSTGDEMSARLGEPLTKDMMKQAWRTALDPKGEWIPAVLRAADLRLAEVRRQIPDAGGLVIASNQTQARAYARHLYEITGKKATIVLSDDADASDRIDAFRESDDRWMVAVRMVSEGVDVPRLSVGVYATNTSTPLFFAQAVGRFVRARKRGETATVFVPSVVPLLELASQMEAERDHALDRPKSADDEDAMWNPEDAMVAQANVSESASSDLLNQYEALGADAEFDGVLFDGAAWGQGAQVGSVEEQEYLGIPGLLDADQVTTLLRARQAEQVAAQKKSKIAAKMREANAGVSDHRLRAAKRKELSHLVSSWSRRSGEPHAMVHAQLRQRCGGPEIARATTEQIEARIALLRQWFVGKH
ncbi:DEAD/DEAH box helicase [Actinomycetaceae bacterium UMB8039B]|uniref:DEAD/DEAH box helicase n=1 Tax=unclassified Pauljensenia TaxID=2908895 RepID=UPI00058D43F8|nr:MULTISPECIES: DEAD/DEAH box helicase [Actinomycetaceae]MDK7780950.1 DEAD/DEAH box helicase [Actinomycetaceae bacterium UMB8041B]MDK8294273.1 DEAD/DEAH box helicase [Actinomycetaceae bacterium UMB8039B]MDK8608576.1 DEAD/DEAH box helicase [Actinomycetaceae bacterium UMB8041A]MDK8753261.1 DEAD/DEAH box helicase [Actinomycetaceae bacterium UMB8039A]MDK6829875.1 DEAD/DEAH box helicase [Pauljensenia sp. UMB8040A]